MACVPGPWGPSTGSFLCGPLPRGNPCLGSQCHRGYAPGSSLPSLPWQMAGRWVSRELSQALAPWGRAAKAPVPREGTCPPRESLASLSTESSPAPQTQGAPDYGCPASTLGVGGQREGAPPSSRTTLGKNSGHKPPSALGCGEPLVPGPRPASWLKAQAVPSWGLTMSLEPGCPVQACSESKGTVGVIHSANTFWAQDLHQALCWAPRP